MKRNFVSSLMILTLVIMVIVLRGVNPGYINYSEFVGACLARREGLRREYAELIFRMLDS